jgi:hypothetical protein
MLNQINEYNKFIGLLIVNVVNYFIIIIGGGIAGFAIYDFFDWC